MLWSKPDNISASGIDLESLLKVMPAAEAKLYRQLIQLIPAPSVEAPNLARRQIEMAEIAKLTGFTKRWVIELMQRLEKKNLIRTDGGSGAVKWIWLLPLGVPRLGKSYPTELTQKEKTSPVQAPRVTVSHPKRRRKETAPSPKPVADVNVAPPVEKPAEMPKRRRKGLIPPAVPAPDNPVVLATAVIPPPPPAPAGLMLPADLMPPPPSSTPPGGPAAGNTVVTAAKIAPQPPTAPGDLAAGNVVVPAATMPPAPSAAPGGPRAGNTVVTATKIAPQPSTAPGAPAAGNTVVTAAKIAPLPSMAPGSPAPGNPVMPAARVTPPPPTEPAAPATPAKRVSPRKSAQKIPAGRSHWESAPIEELVAYACSLPVTPELIRDLKTPGMAKDLLLLALERLCQRIERDGRQPYPDRWSLIGALRTILSDL